MKINQCPSISVLLFLLLLLCWRMVPLTDAFATLTLRTVPLALRANVNGNPMLSHLSPRDWRQEGSTTAAAAAAVVVVRTPTRRWAMMENSNQEENDGSKRNKKNVWRRLVQFWVTRVNDFKSRFQALSKRAKRIFLMQMVVVILLLGGMGRAALVSSSSGVGRRGAPIEIAYSSFLDLVEQQGKPDSIADVPVLDQVRIGSDRISYRLYRRSNNDAASTTTQSTTLSSSSPPAATTASENSVRSLRAYTRKVSASPELMQSLRQNKITFGALTQPRASAVATMTRTIMIGFYFVILWRLYGTVARAGGQGGKSDTPGKLANTSDLPLATFDEIQGIDGAKNEVMELVDTLRNPDKYAILGARAPTGLLLEGPPGVGKTLLARATAASAGVPLLYCSGSDFVEMFVGRGAARVRKLFERAARLSPCLIFIDELDALGKSRDMGGGAAFSRSNDEAEQTLNQLLACMDGLDSSRRICVMAATNRKEVLDPALIRPGRFDRIVSLQLPDTIGREKILRVHCKKLPGFTETSGVDPSRPGSLGKGRKVDLSAIAALTDGLSGAELEFVVNEAAIRAVRRVSAALREGSSTRDIVPHVEATDFEASLASFYATRRKQGRPSEILKNLWK